MRRKLTADERARQLPLCEVPLYPVTPRQAVVDVPVPGVMLVKYHEVSQLVRATGDTGSLDGAFQGVLRVEGKEPAWSCSHAHSSKDGALACAWQARGLVTPPRNGHAAA